jgi:beta-lactamase class A
MFKIIIQRICIVTGAIYFVSCSSSKTISSMPKKAEIVTSTVPVDNTRTSSFLEEMLKQQPAQFEKILADKKNLNVQIIYTQVDRGANGIAALKNFYYNLNPAHYFYPASTVKLPVALLALQRLNELKDKGIDKNTTMITEAGFGKQTAVYNDPTSPDGRPTIAQYIKKILMVSDNDAFNRLYEFLGQEYINAQLQKKGYQDVQILHRLQIPLSEEENRITNPVNFLSSSNSILYSQELKKNNTEYMKRNDSIGIGYWSGNSVINGPMNFSTKNRISLEDLHTILISLVFPNKVHAEQRFNITADDRSFMLKYMSQLPTESTFPPYSSDTAAYWPAYCKFLLFGSEKGEIPKGIRVFNKVGDAYGQMLDIAYIADLDKKVEFFLSAAIYCNSDGILNDDKYEYSSVGFPFMKNLGKLIYDYEVTRTKARLPDLSELKFLYDRN